MGRHSLGPPQHDNSRSWPEDILATLGHPDRTLSPGDVRWLSRRLGGQGKRDGHRNRSNPCLRRVEWTCVSDVDDRARRRAGAACEGLQFVSSIAILLGAAIVREVRFILDHQHPGA